MLNLETLHTFLSALACSVCTDMVYSKELERDVTTTAMAKAILHPKTLAFIPALNKISRLFFTSEEVKCSCSEQNICILSSF